MRFDCDRTGLALAALFGGVSAFAGLCLDRDKPLRGCVLGFGLGVSVGTVVSELLTRNDRAMGLYSKGTGYYEDYQTESGL